jgi:hypothetical protein
VTGVTALAGDSERVADGTVLSDSYVKLGWLTNDRGVGLDPALDERLSARTVDLLVDGEREDHLAGVVVLSQEFLSCHEFRGERPLHVGGAAPDQSVVLSMEFERILRPVIGTGGDDVHVAGEEEAALRRVTRSRDHVRATGVNLLYLNVERHR